MAKNIEMNYLSSSGYEVLYPSVRVANIGDLSSYLSSNYYTKNQCDSKYATYTYLNNNYYNQSQVNNELLEYGNTVIEPVGTIKYTARKDLGSNWLLCNGADFSATDYPELASLLPGDAQSQWFNVGTDGCPVSGEIYECNGYKMRLVKSGNNLVLYYTSNYKVNATWTQKVLGSLTYGGTMFDIMYGKDNRYYIACMNSSGQVDIFFSGVNSLSTWTKRSSSAQTTTTLFFMLCDLGTDNYIYIYNWSGGGYYSWRYQQMYHGGNIRSTSWEQVSFYNDNEDNIVSTNVIGAEKFRGIYLNGTTSGALAFYTRNYKNVIGAANGTDSYFAIQNQATPPYFIRLEDGECCYFTNLGNLYKLIYSEDTGRLSLSHYYQINFRDFDFTKMNQIVGNSSTCWFLGGSNIYIVSNLSDSGTTQIAIGTPKLDGLVKQGSSVYGFIGNNLYTYNSGKLPNIASEDNCNYYIKAK